MHGLAQWPGVEVVRLVELARILILTVGADSCGMPWCLRSSTALSNWWKRKGHGHYVRVPHPGSDVEVIPADFHRVETLQRPVELRHVVRAISNLVAAIT
jgi:hypothetical protein